MDLKKFREGTWPTGITNPFQVYQLLFLFPLLDISNLFDILYKICYNIKKTHLYRSAYLLVCRPAFSILIILYHIIFIKSNPTGSPLTFGKYMGHMEKSLEVAKNCHIGLDWEIGLLPPAAAG